MPFWMGAMGSHDDANHQGTAKRDQANGLAGLDAGGDVLAPGANVELTRDGNGDISVIERTSGETVAVMRRTGANTYTLYNNTVAGAKVIQDSSMKGVANGIAGLDAVLNVNSANVLAGLAINYSGWTTNPGNAAEIADEIAANLSTPGIQAAGAVSYLQYDMGAIRRHLLYFDFVSTELERPAVQVSSNGADWYTHVIAYSNTEGRGGYTVVKLCRYVRFQITNMGGAGTSVNPLHCAAYRL